MKTENVITCEKGWGALYNPVLDMIYAHDDKKNTYSEKIGVKSITCDDGTLTISPIFKSNLTYEIERAIFNAEQASLNTCEFCGATHNVGTTMNNEYKTCCRHCWENRILGVRPNSIWKDYTTNKTYKLKSNG